MNAGVQLLCRFLFVFVFVSSLGFQLVEWGHPQSGYVFYSQANIYGNTL